MFRLQDNVPEVYINESRDFLLLCRLYDIVFSGIKFDIDTIQSLVDVKLMKDSVLELASTKVGFFPRSKINSEVLRYIVAAFPYIIKNKGTLEGVRLAVNCVLKAENTSLQERIPLINSGLMYQDKNTELQIISNTKQKFDKYTVYIFTSVTIYNKEALRELLRYVLPSGYTYLLLDYTPNIRTFDIQLYSSDYVRFLLMHKIYLNGIRGSSSNVVGDDSITPRYIQEELTGAYDMMTIVGSSEFASDMTADPESSYITQIWPTK